MPFKDKEEAKRYMKEYRSRMTQKQRKQQSEKVQERKRKVRAWVRDYKSTLKCEHCGEDEECCLEFHHRDPSKKDFIIAKGWQKGYSIERIKKELDKCSCLCANCHRKEHKRLGE